MRILPVLPALLAALFASAAGATSTFTITRVDSGAGVVVQDQMASSPAGGLIATYGSFGTCPAFYGSGNCTPFQGMIRSRTASAWTSRPSVPPVDISWPHSLAVDHAGFVHVLSWQNPASDESHPLLQDESASGWTATVLDTSAFTSLGVLEDSHDDTWVAWLRVHRCNCGSETPYQLVVAERTAQGWSRDSLEVPNAVAGWAPYPLAVDSTGQPHVLFVGPANAGLYHSVRTGAGWQTTTVDPGTIQAPPQMVIALDGTPHVLYRAGTTLVHAELHAGGWQRDSIPLLPFAYIAGQALALDHAGRPRVAFLAPGSVVRLIYGFENGGSWKFLEVVDGIRFDASQMPMSLILDANDRPSIYFSGPLWQQLSVATLDPATAGVDPAAAPARVGLRLLSRNPATAGEAALWSVSLPAPGPVTLEAFDLAGRRVADSGPRPAPAGESTIAWSPSSARFGSLFVRARTLAERSPAVQMLIRN